MTFSFLSRTKVIYLIVLGFALILLSKLFLLQVVHRDFYEETALRQYATPSSDIFERGTIYFSRKDGGLVSAATQTSGFKIAINPSKIENKEEAYAKISAITAVSKEDFMQKASKTNDPYEEILNQVPKEIADAISSEDIPGVSIFKEKWRFYPGDSLASQTLGIVAYKGDELSGRYGLERQYNQQLSRDINNPYVNFFAEVFSNINQSLFEDDDMKEGDIVTSIEPSVQGFLESTLSTVRGKYSADAIGGIIMNPQDGSIYALSSKPDFDPNDFSKIKNVKLFSNPLVENVLEFGSVVKPLVMASAIDKGVVTAKTSYTDKGSVIVEKKEIFNFDKKGRGLVTMQDVLNQSLNTGMVLVEQKLGRENLRDYLLSFGIKEKTGIDLPNETGGLVSNILNSPREIEYANAAFGQGIAMTPMEMVRALAALGNDGKLVVPHIVKYIKYADGTKKEFVYPETPTKITPLSAEEITRMMVEVMDSSILGGKAKFDRYSVAVKTGTAQVADNVSGGYYKDRHTHSFVGYFPAYDPQFIVFLYAVNPKGTEYAAQTWSEPFLDIAKFLLSYYEVAPDR